MQSMKHIKRNTIDQEFDYLELTLYDADGSYHTEEEVALIRDFLIDKFDCTDVKIEQYDEGGGEYSLEAYIGSDSGEPFYVYEAEVEEAYPASWDDPGSPGAIYCYDNVGDMLDEVIGKEWPLELDYEIQDWAFEDLDRLLTKIYELDEMAYDSYCDRCYEEARDRMLFGDDC